MAATTQTHVLFKKHILIIDDEPSLRLTMKIIIEEKFESPVEVFEAASIEEGFVVMRDKQIDVLLLDKNLGSARIDGETVKINGIEAIPLIKELDPQIQIIVFTSSSELEDVMHATTLGAMTFVNKDATDKEIIHNIEKAVKLRDLEKQNQRHGVSSVDVFSDLTALPGSSLAINRINLQLENISQTSSPVLFIGETGTGKSSAARVLHNLRAKKAANRAALRAPFLQLNMASVPAGSAEEKLFGSESLARKGLPKQGLLELAHGGVLYLDEISKCSLELQAKLVTALEEKKFFRVGGKRQIHSDFCIICANDTDLEESVQNGSFREDLYMRICAFPIRMPSLGERAEDIPEIIKAILPALRSRTNKLVEYKDLPPTMIKWIVNNPPRGNIRGLELLLERILTLCPRANDGSLSLYGWRRTLDNFSSDKSKKKSLSKENGFLNFDALRSCDFNFIGGEDGSFPGLLETMKYFEDRLLREAVEKNKTVTGTAEALKISKAAVSKKLKRNALKWK